jgi:hypothetical protein
VAFIRIMRSPSVSAEVYAAVVAKLDLESEHPLGLMSHAAGQAEGAWQIVEIWDSAEYARRFDRERLIPAIESVTGSPPPADVSTVSYELQQLITP